MTVKIPTPGDLTRFWINGKYIELTKSEYFSVYNLKNDMVVSEKVPMGGPEDVNAVVQHAEAAFKGEWSTFTSAQRASCLMKLFNIMDENLEGLL